MTLHIDIDKNTEIQLTHFANLKKISVEAFAATYLKKKAEEIAIYNEKLQAHLAIGEAQADKEEFADYNLDSLITDLDNESPKNNGEENKETSIYLNWITAFNGCRTIPNQVLLERKSTKNMEAGQKASTPSFTGSKTIISKFLV